MRRSRVPIFPALLLSICPLPWPTHGTPQGMPGTSSKTYLGTGLGYSEAPLHGAQRWWWWWWWCVFCQMDEQLLGSQLDRGRWARTPGPPWITRRQLQEKLPALPSELLQWNQGRTKLGEGAFSSIFLRVLWYKVFFGWNEYFQTFFYTHKKSLLSFNLVLQGTWFSSIK